MGDVVDMQEYLSKEQEKAVLKFVAALTKLDMVKILGCARTLGIKVALPAPEGTKATPENLGKYIRPIDEVVGEMIEAFVKLNREDKRNLLKMLAAAK